jgi:hypothetical protein
MNTTKRPVRFFNTTGPCNPYDHYMLPPEERLVGAQLHRYIRDKLYWVLHAPRQTGKTTFLKSWMQEINNGKPINPDSPFNIKADSAELSNFTKNDIARLFAQRTEETGQQISEEALDYAYEQSKGQPWIVNSLFMHATMRILDENSRETVTIDHIRQAREQMILAWETHLDALAFRMEHHAIQKVMETLMAGTVDFDLPKSEGFRQCMDLGLVAIEKGAAVVANPIYREILARQMMYGPQLAIPAPEFRWENADGSLDMDTLLKEFQQFWRENSETWEEKSDYTEAFPHLLLMAFLQRVLNGG